MRIAVNQPYFFPYAGYISLIKHVDLFVIFDIVQYIRHGWMNRNRILKPVEGWQYITVPLQKHRREDIIKDIKIHNEDRWKERILAQLEHYKKKAPYYKEVVTLVARVFSEHYTTIVDLNKASLLEILSYLGISTSILVLSETDYRYETATDPFNWALNICKAIPNVKEYWNLPSGVDLFDRAAYKDEGIDIKFIKPLLKPYDQKRLGFLEGLSILDVMMFNSIAETNEYLDAFDLL